MSKVWTDEMFQSRGLNLSEMSEKEVIYFKDILLGELLQDEREYCFDKSYCDDELWKESNGEETRAEAFLRAVNHYTNASIYEIFEDYGDKYEFVIDMYIKQLNKL